MMPKPLEKVDDARSRIVEAAVALFAVKGADDVSLRELTAKAGVNGAAVNYYFGSKAGLEEAVFADVASRVNMRRIASLRNIIDAAHENHVPPSLSEIVKAFTEPYLADTSEGALLAQLILKHRVAPSDMTIRLVQTHFDPMAKRYVQALALANPHIDADEFVWRYMFMTSVAVLTATDRNQGNRVANISEGRLDAVDTEQLRDSMVRFLIGGLSAPGP